MTNRTVPLAPGDLSEVQRNVPQSRGFFLDVRREESEEVDLRKG